MMTAGCYSVRECDTRELADDSPPPAATTHTPAPAANTSSTSSSSTVHSATKQRDKHQSEVHTTLEIVFSETQIQHALLECNGSYSEAAVRLFKRGRICYDHTSDFWTLGVLMYQLITGKKVVPLFVLEEMPC
jgi:hypothetical protein